MDTIGLLDLVQWAAWDCAQLAPRTPRSGREHPQKQLDGLAANPAFLAHAAISLIETACERYDMLDAWRAWKGART